MSDKVVIFDDGTGGFGVLAPAFGERLQMMEIMPRYQIDDVPELSGVPSQKVLTLVPAHLREEADDEIVLRAAHCALDAGTAFSIVSRLDVPEEADGVSFDFESMGRAAFVAAWEEAEAAIATALADAAAIAEVTVATDNAALRLAWEAEHAPVMPPPELEPEAWIAAWVDSYTSPAPDLETEGDESDGESSTNEGDGFGGAFEDVDYYRRNADGIVE
tara:strand:- start:1488 stop:2141 length:654 start_codon:yes stop_codon:yes gene_type:complete